MVTRVVVDCSDSFKNNIQMVHPPDESLGKSGCSADLCAMVTLSELYCGFYGGYLLSPGHGSIPGLKSTHVKQEELCEAAVRWRVNNSLHGPLHLHMNGQQHRRGPHAPAPSHNTITRTAS